MSKSTIEEVVTLEVEAGESANKVKFDLPAGIILGCVIYHKSASENPAIVRASIKTIAGADVCKLQHIDNYRSREAGYAEGIKPLAIEGGKTYVYEVIATEPFPDNFSTDLIFVYEDQNKMC